MKKNSVEKLRKLKVLTTTFKYDNKHYPPKNPKATALTGSHHNKASAVAPTSLLSPCELPVCTLYSED